MGIRDEQEKEEKKRKEKKEEKGKGNVCTLNMAADMAREARQVQKLCAMVV